LGGKWLYPKLDPILPLSGLEPHLHDGLMQHGRIWEKGPGRCVPLVTLLRPSVGAITKNAMSPQRCCDPCFQAGPSLMVAAKHK